MKHDLSTEVRALNHRMSHIDEQISQIYNFLSPLNPLPSTTTTHGTHHETNNLSAPTMIPSPASAMSVLPPPMSPVTASISPETNITSVSMTPLFEAPSFYSDLAARTSIFDTVPNMSPVTDRRLSRTYDQVSSSTPSNSIPQSVIPSVSYSRPTVPLIAHPGASTTPRNSISNKIAPAPTPPSPTNNKSPLNTSFQPISNTRYNPGRSPKPKSRAQHGRSSSTRNSNQQATQSTILDLESSSQQSTPTKAAATYATPGKLGTMTKSKSNVFRRFITGGGGAEETERAAISSSSTLLYPPTSDDERPMSPLSSGNDDDDYRPLTSSTSKYYHQTPL